MDPELLAQIVQLLAEGRVEEAAALRAAAVTPEQLAQPGLPAPEGVELLPAQLELPTGVIPTPMTTQVQPLGEAQVDAGRGPIPPEYIPQTAIEQLATPTVSQAVQKMPVTELADIGSPAEPLAMWENPVFLKALSGMGAAIAGPESFASRLDPMNQTMINSRQASQYAEALASGRNLAQIERDPRLVGIDPALREQLMAQEARRQATAMEGQRVRQGDRQLGQGDKQLEIQGAEQRATAAYQSGSLDLQGAELELRKELKLMDVDQATQDRLLERWRTGVDASLKREGFAIQREGIAADAAAAAARNATDRRGQDVQREVGLAGNEKQTISSIEYKQIGDILQAKYGASMTGTQGALYDMKTGALNIGVLLGALPPELRTSAMLEYTTLSAGARNGMDISTALLDGAAPATGARPAPVAVPAGRPASARPAPAPRQSSQRGARPAAAPPATRVTPPAPVAPVQMIYDLSTTPYNRIPSGGQYRDPNGVLRTKS